MKRNASLPTPTQQHLMTTLTRRNLLSPTSTSSSTQKGEFWKIFLSLSVQGVPSWRASRPRLKKGRLRQHSLRYTHTFWLEATDPSLIVCKLSILLKTTIDQLVIHLFSFLLQKELEASYPGMFRLLWRSALPCFPPPTSPHMLLSCSWQVPTYLVKFSNPIRKLGNLSSTFLGRTWYLVAVGSTIMLGFHIFLGLGRSAPCCVPCSDIPIIFPSVGKETARSCSDRPSLTLASVVPSISTLTWRTQCTRKWSTRWRYLANQNRITCWFTPYNTSREKLRRRRMLKRGWLQGRIRGWRCWLTDIQTGWCWCWWRDI